MTDQSIEDIKLPKLSKEIRYYYKHREEILARQRAKRMEDPEYAARQEQRRKQKEEEEVRKQEREAMKKEKQERDEKLKLERETKRKLKERLILNPPGENNSATT
jgi:hypothetical protein